MGVPYMGVGWPAIKDFQQGWFGGVNPMLIGITPKKKITCPLKIKELEAEFLIEMAIC